MLPKKSFYITKWTWHVFRVFCFALCKGAKTHKTWILAQFLCLVSWTLLLYFSRCVASSYAFSKYQQELNWICWLEEWIWRMSECSLFRLQVNICVKRSCAWEGIVTKEAVGPHCSGKNWSSSSCTLLEMIFKAYASLIAEIVKNMNTSLISIAYRVSALSESQAKISQLNSPTSVSKRVPPCPCGPGLLSWLAPRHPCKAVGEQQFCAKMVWA